MDDMTPILEITEADRLRVFREDDAALAELAQITHARAIAEGGKDNAAGHLDLKIRERRAAMWGYDSPVRFDMVQVEEAKRPSSYEMIKAAIMIYSAGRPWRGCAFRNDRSDIDRHKIESDGGTALVRRT
jgi:hypothetical protein